MGIILGGDGDEGNVGVGSNLPHGEFSFGYFWSSFKSP